MMTWGCRGCEEVFAVSHRLLVTLTPRWLSSNNTKNTRPVRRSSTANANALFAAGECLADVNQRLATG
jgi:hypothetical protein